MKNALAQYITKGDPHYQRSAAWPNSQETLDSYLNQVPMNSDYWSNIGFRGQLADGGDPDAFKGMNEATLRAFMDDKGYRMGYDPDNARNAMVDAQGNPVAGSEYSVADQGNFLRDAAMVVAGGYFGGSALAGMGGGAAGAGGALSAEAAGLSGMGSGGGLGVGFGTGATTGGGVGGGFAGLGAQTYGGLGLVEGMGALGGAAGVGGAGGDGMSYEFSNADRTLPNDFSGFQNVGADAGPINAESAGLSGAGAGGGMGVGFGSGTTTGGGVGGGFAGMNAGSYAGGLAGGVAGLGSMAGGGGSSLSDFFSGNGNFSDYMRAGQTVAGLYTTNQASKAAQQGEANNLALLTRMYEQNRADNQPLLDLRNATLPKINGLMADPSSITQTPGYQFEFNQGKNALDNRAAASGNYYSGARDKAATRYGQDFAGTKLDQSLNRLMGVAGLGQVGATANQSNNSNFGTAGGQSMVNSGNTRGSGYVGYGNTLNNGINNWMQDDYMDRAMKGRGW